MHAGEPYALLWRPQQGRTRRQAASAARTRRRRPPTFQRCGGRCMGHDVRTTPMPVCLRNPGGTCKKKPPAARKRGHLVMVSHGDGLIGGRSWSRNHSIVGCRHFPRYCCSSSSFVAFPGIYGSRRPWIERNRADRRHQNTKIRQVATHAPLERAARMLSFALPIPPSPRRGRDVPSPPLSLLVHLHKHLNLPACPRIMVVLDWTIDPALLVRLDEREELVLARAQHFPDLVCFAWTCHGGGA